MQGIINWYQNFNQQGDAKSEKDHCSIPCTLHGFWHWFTSTCPTLCEKWGKFKQDCKRTWNEFERFDFFESTHRKPKHNSCE
jgi:hypothetical protein